MMIYWCPGAAPRDYWFLHLSVSSNLGPGNLIKINEHTINNESLYFVFGCSIHKMIYIANMTCTYVGMHLFNKDNKIKGDEATQTLMKQGVYHVPNSNYDHPFHMDSKDIKKKKVYGFWAGMKYTIILSVLL